MPFAIRLINCVDGEPSLYDGQYIVEYDPDTHNPDGDYDGGTLITSAAIVRAMKFPDAGDALSYYRQSPACSCHGRRDDGNPNRPLTAYTIELVRC